MVARQSKMANTNHNTEQLKHTHINLAVLIRHSLKYKNAVSQKTFYRDTELQMSSKISKGGEEARLKGGGGGGEKGGQKGWTYRRLLPPAETQALQDFPLGFQRMENGGLELGPTRKSEFSAKRR